MDTVLKIILTYFGIALTILLSGLLPFPVPIMLSLVLLIPIYVWYGSYRKRARLSAEIAARGKGEAFSWAFALFVLALSVRIPSVLIFRMPYEKTPLIYLVVLTILLVEKTDISAFGFRTEGFLKSIMYGLTFYAILGGLTLLLIGSLVYLFTAQTPVQRYDVSAFLLAMPFMTLCVGVSEEGLFRGYVQTRIEKIYNLRTSVLFQAALFGVWHFVWNLSPFDPYGMAIYVIFTFLIGLIYGYFYSKSRNLVPLILAHGLWNSVALGIVKNEHAFNALKEGPLLDQVLTFALPYTVSAALAVTFIKYVVKEYWR